jgi:hypothetical protein
VPADFASAPFPIENAELKVPALAVASVPSAAARPNSELVHPEPMLIPENDRQEALAVGDIPRPVAARLAVITVPTRVVV